MLSATGFEFQSNHCCHKRVKDALLWSLIIIRVSNGNDTPTFYTLGENTQNTHSGIKEEIWRPGFSLCIQSFSGFFSQ